MVRSFSPVAVLTPEAAPEALMIRPTMPIKAPESKCNSGRTLWKASLASFAAANTLDIASSWGKRELNPTIGAAGQKFGGQSALLKSAVVGAIIGVEYAITRGRTHSGVYRKLAILNFCNTGIVTAVAARNFTVPSTVPPPGQ
ncbi:MAG TPA: hypothetical protein VFB00_03870 [Terriglobales bacterium]|nr:hypothetical protein [Terriglobales bacterium]